MVQFGNGCDTEWMRLAINAVTKVPIFFGKMGKDISVVKNTVNWG